MTRIYLDNNATTPLLPEVLEAMLPHLSSEFGNASSLHREGRVARGVLESARERTAELLDASPGQVIFTGGGTEANNIATFGLAGSVPCHVVTSSVEHPSVLGCFDVLATRGFQVSRLSVDSAGLVSPAEFASTLRSDTKLASVMLANNETGAIQPVPELAREARARGIRFHTDGVQAVGRIPVSFRTLGVSSLSLSAHKFHGPSGIGALIVEQPAQLEPVLVGGHQESGVRPGTEPVALAVGLAKALELATNNLQAGACRVRQLRDRLEQGLRERLEGARLNGPVVDRVPNTVNLEFPGLDAQAAVMALDLLGLACSTGSACASGAPEPSPVLLAMGLSPERARSSIRFSLSRLTTEQEIKQAIEFVCRVVAQSCKRSGCAQNR